MSDATSQVRRMRPTLRGMAQTIGMIVFAAAIGAGCQNRQAGNEAGQTPDSAAATSTAPTDQVARGKYLVTIASCNDCHTPLKMGANGPEPDMSRFLSGHPQEMKLTTPPKVEGNGWMWAGAATNTAFAGPWGISYAMNLTPDSVTGLGTWTEEMFMKTLRSGKHWGTSRPIMPPMPWQTISMMTDEDLKAVYAFLRTIPAIKNQILPYVPPAGAPAGAPPANGGSDTAAHM
jgi:mono/diheme cytochrome c family protein